MHPLFCILLFTSPPTDAPAVCAPDILVYSRIRDASPRNRNVLKTALQSVEYPKNGMPLTGVVVIPERDQLAFECTYLAQQETRVALVRDGTGSHTAQPVAKNNVPGHRQLRAAHLAVKYTLAQAIEDALKSNEGTVFAAAKSRLHGGKLEFDVTLLEPSARRLIVLDANGKVVKKDSVPIRGQAWTFDTSDATKGLKDWQPSYTHPEGGNAAWGVGKDSGSQSGDNVLTVKAASPIGTYNLLLANGSVFLDVEVSAILRPNTGKDDQGGGLVWRCKDADNYYICRLNPLEGNFRVYRVMDGKREQLQSVDVKCAAGSWYTINARMTGSRMVCSLDGKPLLDVTDDKIKVAGKIGLWTKADASTSFDNVAVQEARSGT